MAQTAICRTACIGAGTIGSGWATLFSLNGLQVALYDVTEANAQAGLRSVTDNLSFLVSNQLIGPGQMEAALRKIHIAPSLQDAVSTADWIQESAFESYDVKQELLRQIEAAAPEDAVYATSSSGLSIARIAQDAKHPERCIVAHPFHPVFLMPLVELVGPGPEAKPAIESAVSFLRSLNKEPVVLNKEIDGYIANRLQTAVHREMCHLVYEGVTDIENLDKAMTFGVALRWAIMGPALIYQLGSKDARTMYNTLGSNANTWLQSMGDFKHFPGDWGDVLQAGVDAELARRAPETGNDNPSLRAYRDHMLIQILKLHNKLTFESPQHDKSLHTK